MAETLPVRARRPLTSTYPYGGKPSPTEGILDGVLGKDGVVRGLSVASGHPLLVPAAIAAVKQWRYKPYESAKMNPPVPEVTVLIHRITKDRQAGEYRLHIKKVLNYRRWDKARKKPRR
jgi:Gram-negative bacterial TonB protein C-terminal